MKNLLALSVRQPWAHAIVHSGKDIENRTRHFKHRGWTLIHASLGSGTGEYADADQFMRDRALPPLPGYGQLKRGGIIGIARVTDSIGADDARAGSPWWMGPCGLTLSGARPLPFIECRGTIAPLFWKPDDAVIYQVRVALRSFPIPELAA